MDLAIGWWIALAMLAWGLYRVRPGAAAEAAPAEVRDFVARFEAQIRDHHPQVEVRGMIPGRLAAVLAVRGQELPVSLQPLFRRTVAFPDTFSQCVAQLIAEVESDALEQTSDHGFADVATSILPQIRTERWVREHGPTFGESALVHRPLTDGLVICYVIDTPWSMTFVCRAHLRQWGLSEDGLFHLSTQNLHQLAGSDVPVPGPADPGVLVRSGDGFDAARVLLLDREQTEGMLVAIPDRDLLWLGAEGDRPLRRLMALNEEQAQRADHPLSASLYRFSNGQLVPVTGP